MPGHILAQSLDTWNPLTVIIAAAVLIYVACQGAVMVIRALRGDKEKTSFEQQMGGILSRLGNVEQQTGSIAKDFVPPDAFAGMLKGQVLDTILEIQRSQDQHAALARPVVPPAPVGTTQTTVAATTTTTQPVRAAAPRPAPAPGTAVHTAAGALGQR